MPRLAQETRPLDHRRVHGELLILGRTLAASTGWEILHEAWIAPAPTGRPAPAFLRSPAEALLACALLETVTLTGARMNIPAVI